MRMSLSLFQTESRNRLVRPSDLCPLGLSGVFELTLAVEGEAPGGFGLLSKVSHSPAAAISTTRDKEATIYYLDLPKLQLGSWTRVTYFRVA